MRARRCLLLLLVGLVACTTTPVSLTGESGMVTVVLRGLVALEKQSDGLHVLFLSPSSDPHPPTLSVDMAQLTGGTGVLPDMTIPDDLGRGIAAWLISEVTLEAGNLDDTDLVETGAGEKVTGKATDTVTNNVKDSERIGWIPHMEDVFGAAQTVTDPGSLIAARGLFAKGEVKSHFDSSKNKSQEFKIGKRDCTAVADAVRIQLKMKDSLQPLLKFKTSRGDGQILVKPGATIALAALPQNKPGKDLEHLHHYYLLIKDVEPPDEPSECTGGGTPPPAPPTGYPVRCAPIKFP